MRTGSLPPPSKYIDPQDFIKLSFSDIYSFIAQNYRNQIVSLTFHFFVVMNPNKFPSIHNYYIVHVLVSDLMIWIDLHWWIHHWSWATNTLLHIKTKKILNLQHHLFRISCYEDIKQHDRWHITILLHLCAFLNLKDENLMNENVKKLSIKVVFLQSCVVRCTEVDKKVTNKRLLCS